MFTDCTAESFEEMMRIYQASDANTPRPLPARELAEQECGETVLVLGSSLKASSLQRRACGCPTQMCHARDTAVEHARLHPGGLCGASHVYRGSGARHAECARGRAWTQCSMDPLPYRQCIYNTRNTRKHVQPDDGDFYDYDSNLDVRCRLAETPC